MKETFKNTIAVTLITVLIIIAFVTGYFFLAVNGTFDKVFENNITSAQTASESDTADN